MPDRYVALRVLRLFRGGGDNVEPDEREEDDGCAGDDSADPEDCWLDSRARW